MGLILVKIWSLWCHHEIRRFLMQKLGVVRCKWVLEPMHWLLYSSSVTSQGSWIGKAREKVKKKNPDRTNPLPKYRMIHAIFNWKDLEWKNQDCSSLIAVQILGPHISISVIYKDQLCATLLGFERKHFKTVAQCVPNLWVKNIYWAC